MIRGRIRPRLAFTLVELLVVIGIIAVLIGILLPTLSKARANAQMTACKSNLQQIAYATRMYANDSKDRYPDTYTLGGAPFRRAKGETNPLSPASLPETFGMNALYDDMKYLPGKSNVWICPSANEEMTSFKCTYIFALVGGSIGTSGKRGKLKNEGVFWAWDNFTTLPWTTGFRRGSSEGLSTIPTNRQNYPHNYRGRTKSGATGDRQGSINVLFADGHVGVVVYRDVPGTTTPRTEVLRGE